MLKLLKYLMYFMLGLLLLGLLQIVFVYGLIAFVIYFVWKKISTVYKEQRKMKLIESENAEKKDTIEYKMTSLLKISGNFNDNSTIRNAYLKKDVLNLQDKWHKFLDIRAKLELNNTSTGKVEAVLHIMCDEIMNRIENVDVEITDLVKKEFIEENLTPLLDDILEILSEVKPTNEIDVNAYELLKHHELGTF